MVKKYVTVDDFEPVKNDVQDIKENHIPHILREIGNLRWFIVGGVSILGIVLAILEVFG